MNSLVLGGTGFVGRRLVEVLVAEGNPVTVLNRGVTPVELPPGVDRLVADRSDPVSMRSALARSDWDAVFDVSGVVKVAGEFPWTETSPTVPPDVRTYGGFKAATEQPLLTRNAANGFPVTVARPAASYGPYNNIYDMEAAMFRRLLERRPILLPYDGLVVCSYGHVDDLCRALLAMATHSAAVGEVFNVTAGAVTSAGYIAALADVVGAPADVIPLPKELAENTRGPLFSRLFTPSPSRHVGRQQDHHSTRRQTLV